MKILISQIEVANMVRAKYGLPDETIVEINTQIVVPESFTKFVSEHGKTMANVGKIAAIRALREITGCGLSEGKNAVEDFQPIADYVRRYGYWPRVNDGEFDLVPF